MYLPPGCVTLEILGLAFQKTSPDFLASIVILAWIMDVLGRTDGNVGIHKLIVFLDKVDPLVILGHRNGSYTEFFDRIIRSILLNESRWLALR